MELRVGERDSLCSSIMFPSSEHLKQAGLGGGELGVGERPAHLDIGSIVYKLTAF